MALATVLSSVALGLNFGSKVAGGIAQGQAAGYQAQVARNNATIARQNAEYASAAGAVGAEREGLRARAQGGGVRAGLAANNLDVNSGSAADTQVSQRELGQLDTTTVAHNAALQAYGYKTQETGYTAESKMLNREAAFAPIEGVLGGAGSLLSNASQIPGAFKWMDQGPEGMVAADLG